MIVAAIPGPLLAWTKGVETQLVANPCFSTGLDPWRFTYQGERPLFTASIVHFEGGSALKVESQAEGVGELVVCQRFKFLASWNMLSPMFVKAILKVKCSPQGGPMRVVVKAPHGVELKSFNLEEGESLEAEVEDALWPYAGRYVILELHFVDPSRDKAYTWLVYEASVTFIDKQGIAATAALIAFILGVVVVGVSYVRARL